MIDLDGLKRINDEGGHDAGDAHLKRFAADLSGAIIDPMRAYRFAGDEYAVMRPGGSHLELRQVLDGLAAKADVAAFSYGVANSPGDGVDMQTVLKAADDCMYEMKERHKQEASGRGNTG